MDAQEEIAPVKTPTKRKRKDELDDARAAIMKRLKPAKGQICSSMQRLLMAHAKTSDFTFHIKKSLFESPSFPVFVSNSTSAGVDTPKSMLSRPKTTNFTGLVDELKQMSLDEEKAFRLIAQVTTDYLNTCWKAVDGNNKVHPKATCNVLFENGEANPPEFNLWTGEWDISLEGSDTKKAKQEEGEEGEGTCTCGGSADDQCDMCGNWTCEECFEPVGRRILCPQCAEERQE